MDSQCGFSVKHNCVKSYPLTGAKVLQAKQDIEKRKPSTELTIGNFGAQVHSKSDKHSARTDTYPPTTNSDRSGMSQSHYLA